MPTYDELREAMTLLTGFTIGVGILIRFLPVGECDKCPHCRTARLTPTAFCQLHKMPIEQCRGMHD